MPSPSDASDEPRLTRAEQRRELHRANQLWHFKKRARQRLGFTFTDDDCAAILHKIKEDKPGVIYLATRHGSSLWRVRWRKKFMVVAYDHRTQSLVTAYKYQPWKWR